jgi:hypothetical protein
MTLCLASIGKWGKAPPRRRSLQGGGHPDPEDETTMTTHGEEGPRWLLPLLSTHLFRLRVLHQARHRSGEKLAGV